MTLNLEQDFALRIKGRLTAGQFAGQFAGHTVRRAHNRPFDLDAQIVRL